MPLIDPSAFLDPDRLPRIREYGYRIGMLPCSFEYQPTRFVGILLLGLTGGDQFSRSCFGTSTFTFMLHCKEAFEAEEKEIRIGNFRYMIPGAGHDPLSNFSQSLVFTIKGWPKHSAYEFSGSRPTKCVWRIQSRRCALGKLQSRH